MLCAIAFPSISSACKVNSPHFADDNNLDLPGILKLVLDPACDLLAEGRHAHVINRVRRYHNPNLAACLDGVHLFHALVARSNALESLEALHVGLESLTTSARARPGNAVARLHQHGYLAL